MIDEQMTNNLLADACIKRIEALEYEFREQQKYVKQLHEAIRELERRITNQHVSDGLSIPTREPTIDATPAIMTIKDKNGVELTPGDAIMVDLCQTVRGVYDKPASCPGWVWVTVDNGMLVGVPCEKVEKVKV